MNSRLEQDRESEQVRLEQNYNEVPQYTKLHLNTVVRYLWPENTLQNCLEKFFIGQIYGLPHIIVAGEASNSVKH